MNTLGPDLHAMSPIKILWCTYSNRNRGIFFFYLIQTSYEFCKIQRIFIQYTKLRPSLNHKESAVTVNIYLYSHEEVNKLLDLHTEGKHLQRKKNILEVTYETITRMSQLVLLLYILFNLCLIRYCITLLLLFKHFHPYPKKTPKKSRKIHSKEV